MARSPATQAEIEWVIAAKQLLTKAPQRASFPSTETYYAAYTAWWDKRIELEKTAPMGIRVTAAEVAAYEQTKGPTA